MDPLVGLVLEEGSLTSHVSIVAKALEIPLGGRAPDGVDRIEPDDMVIVDGNPLLDIRDARRLRRVPKNGEVFDLADLMRKE